MVHRTQSRWRTGDAGRGLAAFRRPRLSAQGVYTFGQPRTCDRTLASAHDKALAGRTFRVVNNNDFVAQVPPEPVFHHVATLRYIDSSVRVRVSMPMVPNLLDRGKGMLADPFAPAADGMRDHFMKACITALKKNLP